VPLVLFALLGIGVTFVVLAIPTVAVWLVLRALRIAPTRYWLLVGAVALAVPVWLLGAWTLFYELGGPDNPWRALVPRFVRDLPSIAMVSTGCALLGTIAGYLGARRALGVPQAMGYAEIVLGLCLIWLLVIMPWM